MLDLKKTNKQIIKDQISRKLFGNIHEVIRAALQALVKEQRREHLRQQNTEVLVQFQASFGRMGNLEGIFFSTDKDLENILGKHVYFGEVLGKHSEIELTLEKQHFSIINRDPEFILSLRENLVRHGNTISGINPFSFLEVNS